MIILKNKEEQTALKYLALTANVSKNSTCKRAKCGSIIVNNNIIIGKGFNSPPGDSENRCHYKKSDYHIKVTDKTCCVHAEQRAIMDALATNPALIKGSRLYFMRIDDNHNITIAGNPYCTICSKMALDSGIKEFVLFQTEGVCVYDTKEYNELSFKFEK